MGAKSRIRRCRPEREWVTKMRPYNTRSGRPPTQFELGCFWLFGIGLFLGMFVILPLRSRNVHTFF